MHKLYVKVTQGYWAVFGVCTCCFHTSGVFSLNFLLSSSLTIKLWPQVYLLCEALPQIQVNFSVCLFAIMQLLFATLYRMYSGVIMSHPLSYRFYVSKGGVAYYPLHILWYSKILYIKSQFIGTFPFCTYSLKKKKTLTFIL